MKTAVLLACGLAVAMPALALAQETPKPSAPAPTGICQHGPNRMIIGGMDPDEMKCQVITAVGQVSEMSVAMIGLQAKLRMAQNDLVAAKAEVDGLRAELAKAKQPTSDEKPAEAK